MSHLDHAKQFTLGSFYLLQSILAKWQVKENFSHHEVSEASRVWFGTYRQLEYFLSVKWIRPLKRNQLRLKSDPALNWVGHSLSDQLHSMI